MQPVESKTHLESVLALAKAPLKRPHRRQRHPPQRVQLPRADHLQPLADVVAGGAVGQLLGLPLAADGGQQLVAEDLALLAAEELLLE
jgi:hypothetical protein